MKKLLNWLSTIAVTLSSVSSLALVTVPIKARAAEQPKTTPVAASASKETVYSYTAQAGDSYSLMARKAVQTYGIKNKVKLSQAKIVAAETNLTLEAGSPYLDLGQKVELKESSVKSWVEKAQKLSAADEAAWNVYAQGANFNTNAVGQSS
jgi:hypothetical protein